MDLSAYVDRQLRLDSSAPATVGTTCLTYEQLADRVETVVDSIRPHVVPGDVVALDIRSPVLGLVAYLSADQLGLAFLPVDVAAPTKRQQWVVENSAARMVLRETEPLHLETCPVDARRPTWPLTDPGYIIYTSGTTGRPKGVHVPKRSLIERLDGLRIWPGFPDGWSILAMSALSFDMSIVEVLLPLAAGGPMVTVDLAVRRNADILGRAVRQHRPGVAQATPSFWRLMIASGWPGSASLTVWCGGEAMTPELAGALYQRCGSLWNLYGPTEATVWASAWQVLPGEPIRLGTEMPGTTLDLVGPTGEVVTAAGAEGELRISGAGIAEGYLGGTPVDDARFDITSAARRYLTGDRARREPDGTLSFLGRRDNQVKLRGHRLELGEIESALESHPAVIEAVVVLVQPDDAERAHLAGAVVARGRVTVRELRRWLGDRLTAVMIPQKLHVLTSLPRTSTGKLDRVEITRCLATTG